MMIHPVGNNFSMFYGLTGNQGQNLFHPVNCLQSTACSNKTIGFAVNLLAAIQKCLSRKWLSESGQFLMIAPTSYMGNAHLSVIGFKPVMTVKNPNSGNTCHHWVEVVSDALVALKAFFEKSLKEQSESGQSVHSFFEIPGDVNTTDGQTIRNYILDAPSLIDKLLEEDENR